MRAILAAALILCALVSAAHAQTGIASVYWEGHRTASGELLCRSCLTAAHRTLPFGTHVKVCRIARRVAGLQQGVYARERAIAGSGEPRCITVRINDRGPFVAGRIIDLTPAGARALHFSGLARVNIEIVSAVQR
jgi:rare lipoprotein A